VKALLQAISMEVVLAPSMREKHSMFTAEASTTHVLIKMPIAAALASAAASRILPPSRLRRGTSRVYWGRTWLAMISLVVPEKGQKQHKNQACARTCVLHTRLCGRSICGRRPL
jgi:hypothetical protein